MRKLVIITMVCVSAVNLNAHPHMWVDYLVHPEISGGTLESIRVEWFFDEYFSSSLIVDMDLNKDRVFQTDEVAYIRENAFNHLIDSEYFADVRIDGEEVPIQEAKNFNTRIEQGTVVYEYSISVDIQLGEFSNLDIAFFDNGYYISFAPTPLEYNSKVFEEYINTQDVDTLGWGTVSVPSLSWIRK